MEAALKAVKLIIVAVFMLYVLFWVGLVTWLVGASFIGSGKSVVAIAMIFWPNVITSQSLIVASFYWAMLIFNPFILAAGYRYLKLPKPIKG
jgi:hypothetical protein